MTDNVHPKFRPYDPKEDIIAALARVDAQVERARVLDFEQAARHLKIDIQLDEMVEGLEMQKPSNIASLNQHLIVDRPPVDPNEARRYLDEVGIDYRAIVGWAEDVLDPDQTEAQHASTPNAVPLVHVDPMDPADRVGAVATSCNAPREGDERVTWLVRATRKRGWRSLIITNAAAAVVLTVALYLYHLETARRFEKQRSASTAAISETRHAIAQHQAALADLTERADATEKANETQDTELERYKKLAQDLQVEMEILKKELGARKAASPLGRSDRKSASVLPPVKAEFLNRPRPRDLMDMEVVGAGSIKPAALTHRPALPIARANTIEGPTFSWDPGSGRDARMDTAALGHVQRTNLR